MAAALPPLIPPPRLLLPPAAAKAIVATGVAVAVLSCSTAVRLRRPHGSILQLASMSVASSTPAVEEFPASIEWDGSNAKLELAGTGLRKKSLLGLKSIVVYSFGVYVNGDRLREMKQQIGLSDMVGMDMEMSVRLVIVYGNLKIGSVRSAFEESIGGRIKAFTGSPDTLLLHSFTQLFKDDIKLPKGTTIDLVRRPGHVLRTTINGQEIGSVNSELLCRCLFDLYVGDQPFDVAGRDAIAARLVSMQQSLH